MFNPLLCILSSTMWIDALQRKADEETLVLQKLTSDWQNYSRTLSAMKTNMSSTTQNMRSLQNNIIADHQRIAMSNEVYYDLTQQVCVCVFVFTAQEHPPHVHFYKFNYKQNISVGEK